MKLLQIVFCAVLIGFSVHANAQINQTNAQGKKVGVWEKKYPNSTVTRYKGQFENDVPVGTFKYYERNGKLSLELNYVSASEAKATAYSLDNGKKLAEGTYINQKKNGRWKYFDKLGRVITIEDYTNDVRDGFVINYYESGNVLDSSHFTNGTKTNTYVYYFDNGKIKTKCHYNENGKLDGLYEEYTANGNPTYKGEYVDGSKSGRWNYYNTDGQLGYYTRQRGEILDTTVRVNGEFTDYYPSGLPMKITNYKDGEMYGKYTELFDNGEYVDEEKVDRRTGEVDTYRVLKGQTIKYEANYVKGYLHGIAKEYNEYGRLLKETLFKMGRVVVREDE